jgi:hypothetical protein
MSSRTLASCGQCGALIRWTRTDAGKLSAMNPRSDPAGNTAVFCDALGVWRSRRPTEELPITPWEKLHVPHVATCTPAIRSAPLPAAVADLSAYRRNRGAPRR